MSSAKKSGTEKSENWLLVEWNSGGKNVVYIKAVVSPAQNDLKIGDACTVNRKGEREAATLIARASDRATLDAMITKEEVAGPREEQKEQNEEDEEDAFASSASSWAPSDEDVQSGDSVEVKPKKHKLEHYKRQYSNRNSTKKVITPSMKANGLVNMINRKRKRDDSPGDALKERPANKAPPANKSPKKKPKLAKQVLIEVKELSDIKTTFRVLFKMINVWKKTLRSIPRPVPPVWVEEVVEERNEEPFNEGNREVIPPGIPVIDAVGELEDEDQQPVDLAVAHDHQYEAVDDNKENIVNNGYMSDEFNRSDDNVLISNKYNNVHVKRAPRNDTDREWVPIGTGQTLIHKDKYKKINWKSYTIATRTLLLAAFPRRILATHSLTGKRSPAFMNKPAKMCLDPKITSDVIIEIMDRFHVRENLVRSIITTKCADECKMWKMRINKKKSAKKENIPVDP